MSDDASFFSKNFCRRKLQKDTDETIIIKRTATTLLFVHRFLLLAWRKSLRARSQGLPHDPFDESGGWDLHGTRVQAQLEDEDATSRQVNRCQDSERTVGDVRRLVADADEAD